LTARFDPGPATSGLVLVCPERNEGRIINNKAGSKIFDALTGMSFSNFINDLDWLELLKIRKTKCEIKVLGDKIANLPGLGTCYPINSDICIPDEQQFQNTYGSAPSHDIYAQEPGCRSPDLEQCQCGLGNQRPYCDVEHYLI